MKGLLAASALFCAIGATALAQPAYQPSDGAAPSQYPPCEHAGQDRCMPSGHGMKHHHGHKGHKAKAAAKSDEKKGGERG